MSLALIIGKEKWRSVESAPGLLASSNGRVMAEPFEGIMPHGGRRMYYGKPWYGAWAEGSGGGRYICRLRGKTYKIARLVCEAFNGPQPPNKPVCMHLDENSRNNLPENLAWGTQKENLNAPGHIAYRMSRTGENSSAAIGKRRREK